MRNADFYECDLTGADFRDADLYGVNFTKAMMREVNGIAYATMSFSGLGYNDGQLLLVDINRNNNPIFFHSDFIGSNDKFIEFIEASRAEYRESWHFARETLLKAIRFYKD